MTVIQPDKLGLYISIPFCRSKCTYCNFASGVYPASEHANYVDRLIGELENAAAWTNHIGVDLPRSVDSVYLGGGTPSLLEPGLIAKLFAAMRAEFRFDPDVEITVECAPGQLGDGTLEALVKAGVNRVSLGVQSFIDREAQVSGRLHTRETVLNDLRRLRAAGLANLNIDLIAGLAGQTLASWNESLAVLIETEVPHASVYMLEVDEDSRLGREMLAGGARYHAELVPKDDTIAQMYETALEQLEKAGLQQYEISNFSREDRASRHNLRYWERRPYLGVGLDASSALYSAGDPKPYLLRSTSTEDLKTFLVGTASAETAWLSRARQHEEAWFLGLRLNRGVALDELRRTFGGRSVERAVRVVERLVESGLLNSDGCHVRLTARGRLLSNEVFQEFVDVAPDARDMREEVAC
jgi:oxygen-independent coproporphyrinogen III oxidase